MNDQHVIASICTASTYSHRGPDQLVARLEHVPHSDPPLLRDTTFRPHFGWQFKDEPEWREKIEHTRRFARAVEAKLGDQWKASAGWVFLDRRWVIVTPDHPKAKRAVRVFPGMCARHISGELVSDVCERPVGDKSEFMCNMHVGHANRAKAKVDAERQRWAESIEADRRATAMSTDLTELWHLVCENLGIERHGDVTVDHRGNAKVDGEALGAVLRWAVERG